MIRLGNWFAKHNDDKAFDEYMKTANGLMAVMAAADARPAPPASATDRLQRNLERTVTENTARAVVLRQEIAAREAELADVLRAEEAASVALVALADAAEEDVPPDGPDMAWPFGAREPSDLAAADIEAACGLALEAEMGANKNG